MKKIIITIILSALFHLYAAEKKGCLNEFYKNRYYIAELVDSCKTGSGYNCSKLGVFDSFKIYAKEPIVRWQKDEYYLWDAFFKVCWSSFALQKIKSVVMDDSILIDILVFALTHPDKNIEKKAFDLLVIKASFPQLIKAHELIVREIPNSSLNQGKKYNRWFKLYWK